MNGNNKIRSGVNLGTIAGGDLHLHQQRVFNFSQHFSFKYEPEKPLTHPALRIAYLAILLFGMLYFADRLSAYLTSSGKLLHDIDEKCLRDFRFDAARVQVALADLDFAYRVTVAFYGVSLFFTLREIKRTCDSLFRDFLNGTKDAFAACLSTPTAVLRTAFVATMGGLILAFFLRVAEAGGLYPLAAMFPCFALFFWLMIRSFDLIKDPVKPRVYLKLKPKANLASDATPI